MQVSLLAKLFPGETIHTADAVTPTDQYLLQA